MKKKIMSIISLVLIVTMLLMGCKTATEEAQTGTTSTDNQSATTEVITIGSSEVVVDTEFTANDLEVGYEEATATKIILNGNGIAVSGDGASATDNVLTITQEGSYILEGSLNDGQIIVDAGDNDKVQLILNGVAITCLSNAPIYVKNADKVFLTLAAGTDNSLIDGAQYIQTDENEVDGVIYSKADLTLNGSGSLSITGNYKHGIVSKDELVITGGIYNITTVKDAINGKDCVKIKDGVFTLSSETGDGIQSKNSDDSTKGYVYISGGTIDILQSEEGIEGTAIIIEDGVITINATDDGFNAASGSTDTNENTTLPNQGTVPSADTMSSQENDNTIVSNIVVTESMETEVSALSSATTDTSADDSNIARGPGGARRGGAAPDGQAPNGDFPGGMGKGGFGGGDAFEVDENCYIQISGGTITVNAQGDGIDSNGSLYISGGTIYVNGPTESMNGSIDYTGTGEITGGIVIAAGSAGMAQGFGESSTQYSILYNLNTSAKANDTITLTDEKGKEIVQFTPSKQYQSVVISTPELVQGETYTLTCGDQTTEITLTSIITSNGQSGWMGQREMGR